MAEVILRNVCKMFGKQSVVKDFCLNIADGEFLVLVGPSGCGKSTTLRLVAGLESLSSGEIRIGERLVNDVHPRDRDVAMVFQNYALYPQMSVYDNMAFSLKMRKVPKAEIDRTIRRASCPVYGAVTLAMTSCFAAAYSRPAGAKSVNALLTRNASSALRLRARSACRHA